MTMEVTEILNIVTINFDKAKAIALRKRYNIAVRQNKEVFTFEDREYVTSYAKYVLDYVEPQFGIKPKGSK